MPQLPHLQLTETAATEDYTSTQQGGGEFRTPPRDGRATHGDRLATAVRTAVAAAETPDESAPPPQSERGILLEFRSEPDFDLRLKSLDQQSRGVELLNVRVENSVMHATVYVLRDRIDYVLRWFEDYVHEETRSGNPKNKPLVESISDIRLAALPAFWTGTGNLPDATTPTWWEVWLRATEEPRGIVERFRHEAERAGLTVGSRHLRFPERVVMLAHGSLEQWGLIPHLFDLLAELREGRAVPTDFLELPPREQGDFVAAARDRIEPPAPDAPAVCLLDTGVNYGHPLLEIALSPEHCLTCEPDWDCTDRRGHGTELAGVALYGDLTGLLAGNERVRLGHRLESVKLLPDSGANDPENYGALTQEAIARATEASPTRRRAICLAVTADALPQPFPTSWSAALDQTAAGESDDHRRLICVSAGNIRDALSREDYPARNRRELIEDPANAWNVLTVGACTTKTSVVSESFRGLSAVAKAGGLCPTSRTTLAWTERGWPLKPDIVMEGGNTAGEESGETTDFIDDLALLTTRVSSTGATLTATAETSAATAGAARYCAIVQNSYPSYWPETVRGLLVHSARWTEQMLSEFPDENSAGREDLLSCYGYGVPDLDRALHSASNAATMIVQESLFPFHRVEGRGSVRTREMHLHELPWPRAVLYEMAEAPVTMRVTLSYFIEPSPGRRGWTRRHRYQSHGLRFDVKRPTETLDGQRARLTRAAWNEEEGRPESADDGRNWSLRHNLRTRGSVHSDLWTGTAAELAESGCVAVHPITGWWRERPHLRRWSRAARYSLIVSLETERTDVDLYAAIQQRVPVAAEVPT